MVGSESAPRILAIHAHPDDIELQCAGTLAKLASKNCEIVIATMTAGDCGSAELRREEIAEIRRKEAKAAADLLGAEYMCLEFDDLAIFPDDPSRRHVTEIVRQVRPDIVITAPPSDYMCDHEATSRLVRDACFVAPIPNYATNAENAADPLPTIPHLYYVDPIESTDYFGHPIEPEFIIDISETFELKEKMLACHESQRAWLRKQHGVDEYLDMNRRWSAKRGAEIGAEYGEGFNQHRGHPYPATNRLKQILEIDGQTRWV